MNLTRRPPLPLWAFLALPTALFLCGSSRAEAQQDSVPIPGPMAKDLPWDEEVAPPIVPMPIPKSVTLQGKAYSKYTPRTQPIDSIVLHTTQGTANEAWFKFWSPFSLSTSTHFIITVWGKIWQLVPLDQAAHHAGVYDERSIGIHFEAWPCVTNQWGSPVQSILGWQVDAAVKLARWLCSKYKIPKIHPVSPFKVVHTGIGSPGCQRIGPWWPVNAAGIVGHYQIEEKQIDPGGHFPWDDFIKKINVPLAPKPIGPGYLAGFKKVEMFWTIVLGAQGLQVTLMWKKPSTTPVTLYFVEMESLDPFTLKWYPHDPSVPPDTKVEKQTVFLAKSPREYRWRVSAENGYGWGPPSAWLYFYAIPGPPSAPVIVSPNQSNATLTNPVTIAWLPQFDEAVYGYQVSLRVYQGGVWVDLWMDQVKGNVGSYTLPTLTPGLSYTVWIAGWNGQWGAWSTVQFNVK